MNKRYEYLDPAGTDEMRKVMLVFSDEQVANMITNIVDQTSGNKAPSAAVVKQLVDNIQQAITNVRVMIDDAKKTTDEFVEYVNNEITHMDSLFDEMDQKLKDDSEGVIPIDVYVVECKYDEIENPIDHSIYIYKDRNKYGLAYYESGEWYVSGMLIPGLETLISRNDIKIIPDEFIARQVHIAYYTING